MILGLALLLKVMGLDQSAHLLSLVRALLRLSMNFVPLINLKLLTIANSFLLNTAEHDIFPANKYENANFSWHFHIY